MRRPSLTPLFAGLVLILWLPPCAPVAERAVAAPRLAPRGTYLVPAPAAAVTPTRHSLWMPVILRSWPRPAPSPTPTYGPGGAHRIGVRVVNGVGEFYDRVSGARFVPRGNNYIRLGPQLDPSGHTVIYHSTFDPGAYDPQRVLAAFQHMHADGYNVVRVFLSQNTILGPDGELSPAYMANVVDLVWKAMANGLQVLFTLDWLPGGKYGEILNRECCNTFGMNNVHYLSASGLQANQLFLQDFARVLIARGAPLDAIWAYELRNELFFDSDFPPLSLTSGLVRTANGSTYDMSRPADKTRMLEENLPYWIDHMRAAILQVDPTALVTVGFFQPQAPNPTRIGDTRWSVTHPAIWGSQADFIDLHPYPGGDLTLAQYVQNFGMQGMLTKPIVMGEFGAFTSAYASASSAAQALQAWQVDSCAYGFDGWLLWTWDSDEQPELWNGLSAGGIIDSALAPRLRPDPCARGSFPGQNVALGKTATASRSLPSNPPGMAVDGLFSNWWGAGAHPPQWIEIDLQATYTVTQVRLAVSQSPSGQTVHRVLGSGAADAYRLLHEFSGVTNDGQVLEYAPAAPWSGIRFIRVETTISPSWVSWREIEVMAGE